MAAFPTNPSVADTHVIGEKTWEWNGYAWDRQASASSSGSHGHTGEDVVDSFNGLTGDVNTSGLVLHVAGISSDNGITLGSGIASTNAIGFSIRNHNGHAFLNTAALNTTIGDVNGDGNGNKILIRDSHNIINLTAATSIGLKSSIVTIEEKLRHDGDTNTHIAFPANDEMTFTTAGVTLAHLTNTFSLQQGLSLDAAGITFPDGTFQSTAGGGGGGSSIGYTAGNTAPAQSDVGTGDFWFENDTGLYYANVFDGTTLGWLQISGIDGATGATGAAGAAGSDGPTLTDVATFSVDSSSAISTGAKTKSLYRVPYNATLTNIDVRASKTGGFTAGVYIAGNDFATPTVNAITGCSLGVSGLTGSSTAFNVSSITAGNFLYLDVLSNNSGSTFAQAFLVFEGR